MPKSERSGQVTFKGWILSGCKEEVLVNFSDTSQLHLYIYQQNICRKINNSARPCTSQVLHAKHEVCSCSENKTGASFFHLSNLKCLPFFFNIVEFQRSLPDVSLRPVIVIGPDIACTVAPTSSDIKERMSVTGACSFSDFPHCCFRHK